MIYLLIVSVIWAFSFGLIKGKLAGLDSHFVAFARLAISFIFFAPFLKTKGLDIKNLRTAIVIGAIQFGLMYIFYIHAYNYLQAWQIALFTVFTPIYVSLINDLIHKKFNGLFLLAAVLAIIGAAIIVFRDIASYELQFGFLLIQVSNICFALGQILYKKLKTDNPEIKNTILFSWLYLGAFVLSGINSLVMTNWFVLELNSIQIYTLLYLGVLASAIGFFLWNFGATKVNAGTLAVFNNLKVPLGVIFAITFFGESADIEKIIVGGIIILLAIFITERFQIQKA